MANSDPTSARWCARYGTAAARVAATFDALDALATSEIRERARSLKQLA